MPRRFKTPQVPEKEEASYLTNPYQSSLSWGWTGTSAIIGPDDDLLVEKGGIQAYNLYNRLLFDETVQSALVKVSQEITARKMKLHPADESEKAIEIRDQVRDMLKTIQMDEIYRGLLEAYVTGFVVAEVMWERSNKMIVPVDIRFRDQRRFRFGLDEEQSTGFKLRLATRNNTLEGIEIPERKFIVFRYWAQNNGDPYGAGLARTLYYLVKFKRRALESQLLYSDRFANPTAIAQAPVSATTEEINEIFEFLANLAQETALVLPTGFELNFVNPSGNPQIFQHLRDTLSQTITILIAGEDEAGQRKSGSRASSEVAQFVRDARAKDLAELISFKLNQTLIRWIVDFNWGTSVPAPLLYRDFSPKEKKALTIPEIATMVSQIGFMPDREWFMEQYNIELEPPKKEQEPQGGAWNFSESISL